MLIAEIGRVRQGAAPVVQEDLTGINSSLDRIMTTMGVLSSTSPLMGESMWFTLWWLVTKSARTVGTRLAEINQARTPLN